MAGGVAPFVPRVTADWLASEPERRWRRVDGALVFVDISGFTAMSERLASLGREGAERVTDIIDEAFRSLLGHAYDLGGSLLKFGGDALLLLFDGENAARRAASAAYEMRDALRRFGAVRTPAGSVELQMSAGVHAGAIDLFLVGRSHRELLVLGPGASSVIEVEGDAGAGNILLSDGAVSALPPEVVGEVHGCGRLLLHPPPAPRQPETHRSVDATSLDRAVSTALRQHLADDGRDRAEHRRSMVAFVHFDGTDRLIHEQGGEAAADALAELIGVVQDAVDRRELCLLASDIDHDGGKVIITAGVPVAHADDIDRLLLTVREIVEAGTEIPVRIGVHGGPLFAGEVGPAYRRTYTVMGDVVNTAARVMSRAPERSVLVTDEILATAGLTFETNEVEPFSVKGKAEPLIASEVGPVRASDASLEEDNRTTILVGRDTELAELVECLDVAVARSGATVELCGPPGVGKTALVRALLEQRPSVPTVVLRCHESTSDVPYRPVRAAVLAAFGLPVSAGSAEARRGLDRALEPLVGDQLEVIEVAIGVREPEGEIDAASFSVDLAAAVDRLLANAFPDGVVLAVDGLHWADEGTASLLRALTSRTMGRRRLVVATSRAEQTTIGGRVVDVTPLSADAAARLALEVGRGRLLPATADVVARRASGNPLYIRQLVDALLATGDDGVDAVGDLPPTLEGLLAARIDRASPSERALIRELAVLGSECEIDDAARYLDIDRSMLVRRLRRLPGMLSVDPRRRVIRFDDSLLADAAYGGLSFRRRRTLHGRAASAITVDGADLETRAEDLSRHCSLAGDRQGAWVHSIVAGRKAINRATFRQAATFFRRAVDNGQRLTIEPDERAEAYRLLGHASLLAGDFDGAGRALQRASRLATTAPRRAAVAINRGVLASERGEHTRAVRHLRHGRRMLEMAGEVDERLETRALLGEVVVRLSQGRAADAAALARRALDRAERIGDDLLVANACTWLLQIGIRQRDPEAVSFGKRATELYETHGRRRHLAHVDSALGQLLFDQGAWRDGEVHARRAVDTLDALGLPSEASRGRANLAFQLDQQHRFSEAAELFAEAERVFGLVDHPLASYVGAMAVAARVRAGDAPSPDEFHIRLDHLLASPAAGAADDVRLAWAEAMVAVGEVEAATAVIDDVSDPTNVEYVIRSPRIRGRIALVSGDVDQAAVLADDAIEAARSAGDDYQLGLAFQLRADVAGPGAGDDARAEAEAILARFGVRSLATTG